jgi:hypothetical protein
MPYAALRWLQPMCQQDALLRAAIVPKAGYDLRQRGRDLTDTDRSKYNDAYWSVPGWSGVPLVCSSMPGQLFIGWQSRVRQLQAALACRMPRRARTIA